MKNKKLILGAVALVLVAALLALTYHFLKPQPAAGDKTVTVTVVHGDGSEKTVELYTGEEYLGAALKASEELAVEGEDGPYGLYIKEVDGERVSDADKTFWALSQDGMETPNGADRTPIRDGERYELTLTKGSW